MWGGSPFDIRVVPDTSHFRRDLDAALARVEKSARVDVETRIDASALRRQVNDAARLAQASARDIKVKTDVDSSQIEKFSAAIRDVDKSLSRSTGTGSRMGAYASLGAVAATAVPRVLALAGGLEQVAGVGLLLPAAFAGAAAGIGTLVVGLHGVKDALKASGDPKKYAAAIGSLAPNAQKAVREMLSLKGALGQVRSSVQNALFDHMASTIDRLGRAVLPIVRTGMTNIATQTNIAARSFANFASSGKSLNDLQGMFANISLAFHNLGPAVAPFLAAMRDITVVGASFLPKLANSLANVTKQFGTFIETARGTGQLQEWMQGGISAVKTLGSVLGGALRTVQGFIKAAQSAGGGGVLGGLATVLQRVADVVNGPAFQKGLTTFFSGLNKGFDALASAMPSLGKALAALGPPLAALATGVGQTLANAIENLTPAIVTLAPALTDIINAFAKLANGAINVLGPLLNDIAGAARFVVQNVPGATGAISALLLVLGANKVAGMLGFSSALTKVGSSIKGLAAASAIGKSLKLGFAAKDVATAGAFAGNVGRVGAVAGKAAGALGSMAALAGPLALGLAAVGGAAFAVQLNIKAMKKANDSAAEAADHLKGSLDSAKQSMFDFAQQNSNAIKKLRTLTDAGKKAYLVRIGMTLVSEDGKTPEEAFAALKKLAAAAGIEMPVNLKASDLSNVQTQLDAIRETAKQAVAELDKDPFGKMAFGAQTTKEEMDAVARSAIDAFKADNFKGGFQQIAAFEQAVKESGASTTAQADAMNYLNDQLLKFTKFGGLSIDNTRELRDSLTQLTRSTAPEPMRKFAQAVLDAAGPSGDLAAAIDKVTTEQPKLAAAAQQTTTKFVAQKTAAQLLKQSLDDLAAATLRSIGGNIGLKAAQAEAVQAAHDLGKSMDKNGTSFDITTKKGRANVAAMNALATSFQQAAQDTIKWAQDHHQSTDKARADIESLRRKLIDQMVQAGLSRSAAKELADQYLKLPKKLPSEAQFHSAKALEDAQTFKRKMLDKFDEIASDAKRKGTQAGSDFGAGVKGGMSGWLGSISSAASALAQAAINAFNRTQDSHSPSRVMIKAGADFVAGFVIGVKQNTHMAALAAANGASAVVAAWRKALGSISVSLKTQPTSVDGLVNAYAKVRGSLLATLPAYTKAQTALEAAKTHTATLREELRKYTEQQNLNRLTTVANVASAKAYLQQELATARAHGASKARVKELTAQIAALSRAHTSSGKAAAAATAAVKAAYRDQIAAAVAAQAEVAKVAAKTGDAYKTALQNAKDMAKALVDAVQAQADALVQAMNDFRSSMTDAIQGGQLDFQAMWGATTDDAGALVPGTVQQLKDALAARLAAVKQFADDLKKLAASGASQDLISEIAGMGPGAGDLLAQQLLEGGSTAVDEISKLMKDIADTAGAGASDLTKSFYKPGVDAILSLIKGMQKSFPELKKALQQIADMVTATLGGLADAVAVAAGSVSAASGAKYGGSLASSIPKSPVKTTVLTKSSTTKGGLTSQPLETTAIVSSLATVAGKLDTLIAVGESTNDKYITLKRIGAI